MAIELVEIYKMGKNGELSLGNAFVLPNGKVSIGKLEECSIDLAAPEYDLKDPTNNAIRKGLLKPVSRRHCEVESIDHNGPCLEVKDFSTHGTFIFPDSFTGLANESPDRVPEFTKDGYCNCRNPDEWKVNDKIPISYFEDLNEYHLMCKGGHGLIMNYCYFCGGKLPNSLRGQYFLELEESEVDEAKSFTKKIDTIEKIYEVLGEPDEIVCRDPKEKDLV